MANVWTNEKWVETLTQIAESKRGAFEAAQGKMIRVAGNNPVQAVEWEAGEVVAAQTAYFDVWKPLVTDLAEHSPAEVMAETIKTTEQKVGWTLGGGSTCPFHRAVERVKGETLFRELRDLRQMVEFHLQANESEGQN